MIDRPGRLVQQAPDQGGGGQREQPRQDEQATHEVAQSAPIKSRFQRRASSSLFRPPSIAFISANFQFAWVIIRFYSGGTTQPLK